MGFLGFQRTYWLWLCLLIGSLLIDSFWASARAQNHVHECRNLLSEISRRAKSPELSKLKQQRQDAYEIKARALILSAQSLLFRTQQSGLNPMDDDEMTSLSIEVHDLLIKLAKELSDNRFDPAFWEDLPFEVESPDGTTLRFNPRVFEKVFEEESALNQEILSRLPTQILINNLIMRLHLFHYPEGVIDISSPKAKLDAFVAELEDLESLQTLMIVQARSVDDFEQVKLRIQKAIEHYAPALADVPNLTERVRKTLSNFSILLDDEFFNSLQ
ncbi:MAG: hypothetical protein COV44_06740 [Deltaproteobacteria bacterium CG11_big_fil_rev_8_21_14_0_20_45_16]|nr:MAG: hypothetical protein COV44_06740 [Deltaproteobacteria bacterium CG11_big_fil_rev_8_21_14_0_20_45_16]